MANIEKDFEIPLPVELIIKASVAILPVTQIAIGAMYLNECPREYRIPIYLVVMGVFTITSLLFSLPCMRNKDGTTKTLSAALIGYLFYFIFCWFIAGNIWIYGIYQPNYEKNNATIDTYCNKTLYLFAFWSTTLTYILLGVWSCMCGSVKTNVGA